MRRTFVNNMKFRTPLRTIAVMAIAFYWASAASNEKVEGTPRCAESGELILARIPSAPFPHPKRTGGHKYRQETFPGEANYQDNTVGIFIPRNFRPGEKVDFVVHFHGWRYSVTNALRQQQLIDQFAASGKNTILVVPQGPLNAADSFGGKLEDANGFKRFMDDVLVAARKKNHLQEWEIGTIILSGHSGGYQVISSILDLGGLTSHVKEVWLFDGLYGQTGKFKTWIEQSNGRFIDFYTANGGTKTQTETLMDEFKKQGTQFLAADENNVTAEQSSFLLPRLTRRPAEKLMAEK